MPSHGDTKLAQNIANNIYLHFASRLLLLNYLQIIQKIKNNDIVSTAMTNTTKCNK
jgi:hypothetical protein